MGNNTKYYLISIVYFIFSFLTFGLGVCCSYLLYGPYSLEILPKYALTIITINSIYISIFNYIISKKYKDNYIQTMVKIADIIFGLSGLKYLAATITAGIAIDIFLSVTTPFALLIMFFLIQLVGVIIILFIIDIIANYVLLKLCLKKFNLTYKITALLVIANIIIIVFL